MPTNSTARKWKAASDAAFAVCLLEIVLSIVLTVLAIATDAVHWLTAAGGFALSALFLLASYLCYRQQVKAAKWPW